MKQNDLVVGQRWISDTEPELGLGIVVDLDARAMTVFFPCADDTRHSCIYLGLVSVYWQRKSIRAHGLLCAKPRFVSVCNKPAAPFVDWLARVLALFRTSYRWLIVSLTV